MKNVTLQTYIDDPENGNKLQVEIDLNRPSMDFDILSVCSIDVSHFSDSFLDNAKQQIKENLDG